MAESLRKSVVIHMCTHVSSSWRRAQISAHGSGAPLRFHGAFDPGADVFTAPAEFMCWSGVIDTPRTIRSVDNDQTARHAGARCRARSAGLAHFRNLED